MASPGRPTKYSDNMLTKAQTYVQQCQSAKDMPFIEELALLLDVNDDTIVEWTKEHDEFSATVKKLRMLQKLRLKQGALCKQLQPSTAIFLLRANHGLDEKKPQPVEDCNFTLQIVDSTRTIGQALEECEKRLNTGKSVSNELH